ncbi:MAG: hypothetical protein K2H82_00160 [Oscillospiraceae bacterium]|nr:hypothetical protein [Oscillospiraceae bacterium]
MTPFDMTEKPVKQNGLLMPFLWTVSYVLTRKSGLKQIEKIHLENCKPPYLVLATHQGFLDYFIAPRALFPYRANYVSDIEGFANYGKFLYRQGGCIAKRRYVPDITVMNHIRYALHTLRQSIVIFPESRHCAAGITSTLPENLGKLAKLLNVPVVILKANGCYLANPFWDESHTRPTKLTANLRLLHTPDELQNLSAEQIQQEIAQALQYDEYQYQEEQKIRIRSPHRAEGLHLPLYQCLSCGREGTMQSKGVRLFCARCGVQWELNEAGLLSSGQSGGTCIPEWYNWERMQTEKQISSHGYELDIPVSVQALPNEHGFVRLGTGRLHYNRDGFLLSLDHVLPGLHDKFPLRIPGKFLPSCQTEYNYQGQGKSIVLSTQNCCYYIYSKDPAFLVTKLEFAVEINYKMNKNNLNSLI